MMVHYSAELCRLLVITTVIIGHCTHCLSGQCFSDTDDTDGVSGNPIPTDLSHITKFGLDLFKQLLPTESNFNLFLSPYSIWNSLALAFLGSEGETKAQLQRVLGIKDKVSTLKAWKALDYIYRIRQINSKGFYFGMANRVYFNQSLVLKDCIKNILPSELQLVDFSQPHLASSVINDFVLNITEGKIAAVVSPKEFEDVSVALVNAAFFSDIWKSPFKKKATTKTPFYAAADGAEEGPGFVRMMKQHGLFKHGVSETLRAHILELPYSLSDISMFIFLPPSAEGKDGFDHLLKNLNEVTLQEALTRLWLDEMDVAVPKLELDISMGFQLKQALQKLGIRDMFVPHRADFSSFVPEGGISISKTLHRATLSVTEEGTEASGATVVMGAARSARPNNLRTFVCDHPFIFIIYDKLTHNILFMGAFRNSSTGK